MNKLKKIFRIMLIVLFPLGVLFCIGKNLFSGNFVGFLGGLFLFVIGAIVGLIIFAPEVYQPIINFFRWLL